MTLSHMRKLTLPTSPASAFRWTTLIRDATSRPSVVVGTSAIAATTGTTARCLAQVRQDPLTEVWFSPSNIAGSPASSPLGASGNGDRRPPDDRRLKLGKTLRTLSPLLPNILTTPVPPEILSPSIVLHLFPSTHPHLPSVRGKVPYRAAVWTAPVAWGSVPIVGNVKLRILSEKIVRTGLASDSSSSHEEMGYGEEKLVVRWKTESSSHDHTAAKSTFAALSTSTASAHSTGNGNGGLNRSLSKLLGGDKPIFSLGADSEFSGLFIFSFDEEGLIASHTIEHADENTGCDKTSRVVTLTDWLLGKAKGRKGKEGDTVPELAMRVCREEWSRSRIEGSKW